MSAAPARSTTADTPAPAPHLRAVTVEDEAFPRMLRECPRPVLVIAARNADRWAGDPRRSAASRAACRVAHRQIGAELILRDGLRALLEWAAGTTEPVADRVYRAWTR